MSGLPGTAFQWIRYPLIPGFQMDLRKVSSGRVSLPLLALITLEVASFSGIGALPSRK